MDGHYGGDRSAIQESPVAIAIGGGRAVRTVAVAVCKAASHICSPWTD